MRILIVDDEELDLFIGRKLLGTEYEIEGFTTVHETVNWAKQNDFDIALIDYYLGPGLFAGNLLTQLKAIKGFKSASSLYSPKYAPVDPSTHIQ